MKYKVLNIRNSIIIIFNYVGDIYIYIYIYIYDVISTATYLLYFFKVIKLQLLNNF